MQNARDEARGVRWQQGLSAVVGVLPCVGTGLNILQALSGRVWGLGLRTRGGFGVGAPRQWAGWSRALCCSGNPSKAPERD